jgi:hypothetical protein
VVISKFSVICTFFKYIWKIYMESIYFRYILCEKYSSKCIISKSQMSNLVQTSLVRLSAKITCMIRNGWRAKQSQALKVFCSAYFRRSRNLITASRDLSVRLLFTMHEWRELLACAVGGNKKVNTERNSETVDGAALVSTVHTNHQNRVYCWPDIWHKCN